MAILNHSWPKKVVNFLYLEKEKDRQDRNNYCGVTLVIMLGKELTQLLLRGIRPNWVKFQKHEPGWAYYIQQVNNGLSHSALRLCRASNCVLAGLSVYIALQKTSKSVHCDAFSDILRIFEILAEIIDLMKILYSENENTVKYEGGICE